MGAAVASISGEGAFNPLSNWCFRKRAGLPVDVIEILENRTIEEVIEALKLEAVQKAIKAGAMQESVRIVEIENLPVQVSFTVSACSNLNYLSEMYTAVSNLSL